MKKVLKLLVLLLTVALIVGVIAVVASAEDEVDYGTNITEALASATGTYTLEGDSYIDATVDVTANLTIDLAGYTLTTNCETAFTTNATAEFTITGSGAINVFGHFITSTTKENAPTVKIVGTGIGIDVSHTGALITEGVTSIVDVEVGTYTFTNVDFVSTATGYNPIDGRPEYAYFQFKSDADVTFNYATFTTDTGLAAGKSGGQAFLRAMGTTKVTLNNSAADVDSSGLTLQGLTTGSGDVDEVVVLLNNTIISAVNDFAYSGGKNDRCFGVYACAGGTTGGNWDEGLAEDGFQGTLKLTNGSVIEANYRVIVGGDYTQTNAKVVVENSTLKNALKNDNTESDSTVTREIPVYFKSGAKVTSGGTGLSQGNTSKIYFSAGSRTTLHVIANATSALSALYYEDGTQLGTSATYKFVYDPAGDASYPFMVVTAADAANYAIPDAYDHWGFENIRIKYNEATDESFVNDYGTWQVIDATKGGDFATGGDSNSVTGVNNFINRKGSFGEVEVNGNSAFKFWVNPAPAGYAGNKIGETRNFTSEKNAGFGSAADTYFIFGDKDVGKNGVDTTCFATTSNGAKVMVVDFDFGSDSELGFPSFNMFPQGRMTGDGSTSNSGSGKSINFDADGNITNNLDNKNTTFTKVDTNSWHHVTFVFYFDSNGAYTTSSGADKGIAYVYIDNVLLGQTNIHNGTATYIQGVRMGIGTGDQTVGTSLLFDNISRRMYKSYADGETAAAKTPDAYLLNALPENRAINTNITVGGIAYDTVNNALAAAGGNGAVNLNSTLVNIQNITNDGYVDANGNTITMTEESYASAPIYLADGTIAGYEFNNEKYSAYFVTYYWYNGPLTGDPEIDEENFNNIEYYVTSIVKMGQVPVVPEEVKTPDYTVDAALGVAYPMANWYSMMEMTEETFAPLSQNRVETAMTDAEGMIICVPVYSEESIDIVAYVTNGGVVESIAKNDSEFSNIFNKLNGGDTLMLLDDVSLTKVNNRYESTEDAPAVINVDLNGHSIITQDGLAGYVIAVGSYTTVNVYSSQPGGYMLNTVRTTSNGDPVTKAQRMFAIFSGSESWSGRGNTQSILNIGRFEKADGTVVPGENLTVNSGVLFEGLTGDDTCAITVDGVTALTGLSDSSGRIMTRYYDGSITVKNTTAYCTDADTFVDMKAYNDGTVTPTVTIDNCTVITRGGNFIANSSNGTADAKLIIKDVVTNGIINGNEATYIEGTCYANGITGNLEDGYVVAKVNAPLALDEDIVTVQSPRLTEDKTAIDINLYSYIVSNGKTDLVPEGAIRVIELTKTAYTVTASDNVVNVNWVDLTGETITEVYVSGGNVEAIEIAAAEGNAVKKVFTGFDKVLPATAIEDMTITAQGEYVQNLKGLLSNLTLYASFEVNLYIPAAYGEFITVFSEGNELETTIVTINDAQYIKVCVARDATAAMSDAIFDIEITEGVATVETSVTMSVATYATTVLEGEYTEADKSLVKYVINYANEAANYANLPNAELAALAEQYAVEIGEQTYVSSADMSALAGIVTDASVILGNAPGFVFYVAEGVTELTVNGKVYAAVDGVVLVTDIRAYDFLNDVTVASGDKTGTYDFAAFAAYHAGSEDPASVAAMSVIEAVYAYVTEAAAYNAANNA